MESLKNRKTKKTEKAKNSKYLLSIAFSRDPEKQNEKEKNEDEKTPGFSASAIFPTQILIFFRMFFAEEVKF